MNLAIFIPSLSGGGAERVVLNLIQGFQEYNINLELILAQDDGIWQKQLPENCSIVILHKKHVFLCLFPLIRHLRKSIPDILFSAIDNANLVNVLACRLSGKNVKSIISIHQVSSEFRKLHDNRKEKILGKITNVVFPLTDKMIVVSEEIHKDILKNFRIPDNKIVTIGNPIIKSLDLDRTFDNSVRVKNKYTIVAFGRLAIEKDFGTLITAFNLFLKSKQGQLIIYGEGPERQNLENLCENLGVEKNVSMPGFEADVFGKLRQADLCVISSITEGFGNVIIEAFACGIPVVSTDCGGPREILQNGKFGSLVPIKDAEALNYAMLETASHKIDPALLKERAREYTIENISLKYKQVFFSLLNQGA
jgi:glycosyltransferase involved in cell wall biosynthesis